MRSMKALAAGALLAVSLAAANAQQVSLDPAIVGFKLPAQIA